MFKKPIRLYATALKDRTTFRFHINQLDAFKTHLLKYYNDLSFIECTDHRILPGVFPTVEHHFKPGEEISLYDNQIPIADAILAPGARKMVNATAGSGKTIMALYCAVKLKARTLLTFKGGYITRWTDDISDKFDLCKDELLVVDSSSAMVDLQEMAVENELNAKFIVITTGIMRAYLRAYELNSGDPTPFAIHPDVFHRELGTALHIKDEFHQEHHLNHRIELYTDCPKTIALSATMRPSDPFLDTIYQIGYPLGERLTLKGRDKFVVVTAMFYRFRDPRKLRYKNKKNQYSHNEFETWLMSHPHTLLANYTRMVERILFKKFVSIKNPNEKSIVFCSSVELCSYFQKYFANKYPTLKVSKYTQIDPYSNLMESDLTFSTVLSAGTAVDVPLLRFVLMLIGLGSRQSNEQAMGRPRELWKYDPRYKTDPKLKEIRPEFGYLVCEDIQQTINYHESKVDYFRDLALIQHEVKLPDVI
ncbi:hypothetical protein ACLPJK_26275 [Pseudomonas aeruginosa]|uniref:hypothetical protein n=1 Tax=Pseudomonas aeruginosa TaxID=287 RepID=UPI003D2B568D